MRMVRKSTHLNTRSDTHMNSFDRQFQQRLEFIFKKAEIDQRVEAERKAAREAQNQNDSSAKPCPKKDAPKPR